jgi:hypothetical protein
MALLAAIALAPDAGARHEKCLPPETYAIVQQTDFAAYKKRLEAHPLTADIRKAGFGEYFAPAFKAAEEAFAKDGRTAKEFARLVEFLPNNLDGEVLFSIVKTPKPAKGHLPFDFIAFADIAADEKTLVELLEKYAQTGKTHTHDVSLNDYNQLKAELEGTPVPDTGVDEDSNNSIKTVPAVSKWTATPFQGVTLHEHTVKTGDLAPVSFGGWALAGKTLVIATSPNALRESVDALQNGRKDNFSTTPAWKRVRSGAGNADIIAAANTPFLAQELRNFIVGKAKEAGSNLMSVDFVKAYDTLRLGNILALWVALEVTPADVRIKSSLSYTEKSGLLSLLTHKPLDPLVPAFIPAGKVFDTANWDMTQAWKNLESLLAEALPTIKPLLDIQLASIKSEHGLDVRDALLENFGQNMACVFNAGKNLRRLGKSDFMPSNEMLFIMELRDSAKLASFIETALAKLGKGGDEAVFDEIDYMGVKIRSLKRSLFGNNADVLPHFAYAIHDGKFFFAMDATDVLKRTIAEIKTPQNPAAKDPSVQKAMKYALKDAVGFSYADISAIVDIYLDMIEGALDANKVSPRPVDRTKRPAEGAIPWLSVSTSHERADGIYGETVIFRKEDK